jgi:hypothetical protein
LRVIVVAGSSLLLKEGRVADTLRHGLGGVIGNHERE